MFLERPSLCNNNMAPGVQQAEFAHPITQLTTKLVHGAEKYLRTLRLSTGMRRSASSRLMILELQRLWTEISSNLG